MEPRWDGLRDAELVDAARRGERAALGVLFERHRPLLLALCRRALRDGGLAEDAAQEACLQAMLALDRLQRPERFGPWLAGIGLNVCRRSLRARQREGWTWAAVSGGRWAPEPADPEPGPEAAALAAAEAAEVGARIRSAVASLPAGQRDAAVLYYLRGLSSLEVAEALGIEPGAVKTRLYKARRSLRGRLATMETDTGTEATMTTGTGMVDVRIAEVRRLPAPFDEERPARHWIVLEDAAGTRRMAIWIGPSEADALAVELERLEPPRPHTYDLAATLLGTAGAHVVEVRIDKLAHDTFFATLAVDVAGARHEIDARPSDALNLALRTGAPIRVAADVFERASTTDPTGTLETDAPPEQRDRIRQAEGTAEIVAHLRDRWRRKE